MKRGSLSRVVAIALFVFIFSQKQPAAEMLLEGRSPQWRPLRNAIVEAHPYCSMCGVKQPLEVHHKKPYHIAPELELVESNCCVLCRHCHFYWGHDPDGPSGGEKPSWSKYNPNIDEAIKRYGVK